MVRSIKNLFYSIEPLFFIVLAAAVLIVPVRWMIAWLIAGFIHELGHYIAIRISGKKVYAIRISGNGVLMETDDLGRAEGICALAGPLTGLLLFFTYRWFPRLAVCGLVQSVFNLLPVYPMDGGRVLAGILRLFLPEKYVDRTLFVLGIVVFVALILVSVEIMCQYPIRLLPMLFVVNLIRKARIVKFSCKDGRLRVQ